MTLNWWSAVLYLVVLVLVLVSVFVFEDVSVTIFTETDLIFFKPKAHDLFVLGWLLCFYF